MAGVQITQLGTRINENEDLVVRFSIVLTSEPDNYVAVALTGGDDTEAQFTGTSLFPVTSPVVGHNTDPFVENLNDELANAGISTSIDIATLEATPANVVVFAPRIQGIDAAIEESSFSTPLIIEVTGLDDLEADGDQVVNLTPIVVVGTTGGGEDDTSIDPGPDAESYTNLPASAITDENGSPITSLSVTNTDNEGFAIDVSAVTGSLDEANQTETGSYTITLGQTPTEAVEITIDGGTSVEISTDNGATFSGVAVAFFDVGETTVDVIVRAADDAIDQGGPYTSTISHEVTGATSEYPINSVIPDVQIEVLDNEMPFVSFGTVANVTEDSGGTGSVIVVLDRDAPLGGLAVPYSLSGSASEGFDFETLSGEVVFAEGTREAIIEITPIEDKRDEGSSQDVVIALDESLTDYRIGENGSATIEILDDDTAGVLVSETDLSFDEGGSASYTVVLTSDPSAEDPNGPDNFFSIRIDGARLLSPPLELGGDVSNSASLGSRLSFTGDDWFVPKTVFIERPIDGLVTGDQSFTLENTVLANASYSDINADSVSVGVAEVDTAAGFLITPGPEGLTGFDFYSSRPYPESFNIALTSVPLTDVVVLMTHDFTPGQTVNGFEEPPITFLPNTSPTNPNETLLVFTPDERDLDVRVERLVGGFFGSPVDLGNVDVNVSFEVLTAGDDAYDDITIDPITVTVVPLFEAGLDFTPVNGTDLDNPFELIEGQTFDAGFRIKQSTLPLGDVAFRISSSDGIDFTVINTGSSGPALAQNVNTFDFGQINRATDGLEFQFTATDDAIDRAMDLSNRTFEGLVTIEVLDATNAPEYESLVFDPFSVIVTENDLAGITVTETDGGSIAIPGGRADVLRIDFDSQPVAPVTISVTTNDDIESVADIVVQPEDWATSVEIPLAAVLDDDTGDETVTVAYVTSSADPKFDALGGSVDVFIPDVLDNAVLADGLDTALTELQDITNAALDFDLLFVDTSNAMPDMFAIFKDDLVTAIENEGSEDPDTLVGLIETTIESSFDGIPFLQDTDATVEIGLDPSAVSFDVVLEFDDSFETDISADFGIPALGFDLDGSLISDFGYSLGFGFGIDKDDGFFLNADTTSLAAGAGISLGNNFEATGNIGFVGLTATNNEDNPTNANIDFSFGIADPNDDGRLTLSEIQNTATKDLFDTTFNAGANAALDFETSFAARTTQFPSFLFSLESEWDAITFEDGELSFGGAPSVAFNDIGINIGTFLNRFAEPILNRVDGYIDPFRPVLEALQTDIPILSEFGIDKIEGQSIKDDDGNTTIVSILEAVQNVQIFQDFGFDIRVSGFINAIDEVQQFISDVSEASTIARENGESGLVLNLGSYEIDLDPETFDAEEGSSDFEDAKSGIQGSTAGGEALTDPATRIGNTTQNNDLKNKLFDITNAFGFQNQRVSFPVIQDVENIFGLLTGSATDVSLFEVNFPTFALKGGFEVPIPIFAFLGAAQPTLDIGGSIGIEATFGLGYDTQGFFTWADEFDFATDKAHYILDGLYLTDTRDGEDIDEITLTAGVQGSLGIKGVARGTGGLEGEIGLDFNDVGEAYSESDGRVRVVSEIAERLLDDPTKIFNFTGVLSAFVEGYLIAVGTARESIELVRIEIENGEFSISTAFDGPINGANVYFDSNFNGVQDDFEPWTLTGADAGDGSFELAINLSTFDVNGNGVIDASEGRIVVEGGIDLDTTQFQQITYTSQSDWAVVSPLTMLATELGGVNPDDTQRALREAFGLPQGFVLAADDPLQGMLDGDPAGAEAFKLLAQVDNLIILGANTLGDELEVTAEELFDNVYAERDDDTRETGAVAIIAELGAMVSAGGSIDLTDPGTIRAIIEAAAAEVGVTPAGLDDAIAEIEARNASIDAVTATGETGRAAVVAQIALDEVDVSYDFVRNNLFFRLVVASRETPDVEGSVERVAAAFALPSGVDLTSFNAVDAVENGNLDGLKVYAIGNQITATLIALNGVTGNPTGDLAALLGAVEAASGAVDLSDPETIAALIETSDPSLTKEVVDALADEIASINAEIDEIVESAGTDTDLNTLRSAIAGIQSFVQDTKIDIFKDVASGLTPVDDLPNVIDEVEASFGAGFSVSTEEDEIATANLLDDIEEAIDAELTIGSVEGQSSNVGQAITLASGATVLIDVDGNITYDPNGVFDSLNDGQEAYEQIAYSIQPQGDLSPVDLTVTVRINGTGMSNTAPVILSPNLVDAAENQTSALDVQASDDSDAEGAGLTYSITGGADAALFGIDAATGVVSFLSAPDFETPGDDNSDNDYEVQVTVTDSGVLTDVQDLTISVTDEDDTPTESDFTYTLVDTDSDTEVGALFDGITFDPGAVTPPGERSILVDFIGDGVAGDDDGSMRLQLFDENGNLIAQRLENAVPYVLFGDNAAQGFFDPTTPLVDGSYALTATMFSQNGAKGTVLGTETIDFTLGEVIDPDPALDLTINQAGISENGGTATGTVTRLNGGTSGNLVVTLNSDDTSEATVPTTVTILDGFASADFQITAVDDVLVDGDVPVTISASASGFDGASEGIIIEDDEVPPPATAGLEIGSATVQQPNGSQFFSVTFTEEIENARVVLGPVGFNGNQPATTRVMNVTDQGFEFQVAEWQYLNGAHVTETVFWMAMSEGDHTLADGTVVSAGRTTLEDDTAETIALSGFSEGPAVFGQVTSFNEVDTVADRISDVSSSGFTVRMQEEEALQNGHAEETFDWIAIEYGDGSDIDVTNIAGLGSAGDTFVFDAQPDVALLANMQSFKGKDTAVLRYDDLETDSARLFVEEEKSANNETFHLKEETALLTADIGSYDLFG